MKGFPFGVFFAIRGVFQLFGSMVIFLFSSQTIWENSVMREHPPVVSCLSRCILSVCIVIMNLVLFIVAAKRYKHWERKDRPDHMTNGLLWIFILMSLKSLVV